MGFNPEVGMLSDGFSLRKTCCLPDALGLRRGEVLALVGGGGKTSLMFRLAAELASGGSRVITTTTTRILPPDPGQSSRVIVEQDEDTLTALTREALIEHHHVTLARLNSDEKLKGLLPETIDLMHRLGIADFIINEADGAARQPLKAPNATEPVIPVSSSLVVALVGIEAIGRPLSPETAFRVPIISRLTGLEGRAPITKEAVATLLTHPAGIIQHSPPRARIVPFINKVDEPSCLPVARALAEEILERRHPQIERVVFGAIKHPEQPLKIVKRNG